MCVRRMSQVFGIIVSFLFSTAIAFGQNLEIHYINVGWAGPGPDIHAAAPQYFTLYQNWFIQTLEPDLDASIKRILGQTNRPPR
jgi:hypothetical protein